MVILLFLHMARVYVFGAYKYPRELTWLTGAILFIMVMAMSFTGYLLVWDQRAYWATVVGVNINGTGPIVGPYLANFFKAGPEFGDQTLSRFYSLHMLVIPGGIFTFIFLHMWLVVRLGVTSPPWSRKRYDEADGARGRGEHAVSDRRTAPAGGTRHGTPDRARAPRGVPARVRLPEEDGQVVLPGGRSSTTSSSTSSSCC